MERRLAAIMAADVVDYTRIMEEDQTRTIAALRRLRSEIFDPDVAAHQGQVIKNMGDGWLVEFHSVVDAVDCAVALQRKLAEDSTLKLRIGVHLGDIVHEDVDIFGDGVNVAARLQETAAPGAVAISDIAQRCIDDKSAAGFVNLGPKHLKNVKTPTTVYAWGMSGPAAPVTGDGDRPTIAVLPFDNMSGDPEQSYFSDGLSEDIITALSKHKWIDVVARNTSFAYRGGARDIRQVAGEMGADYVVEGSVRRSGNRIRVTAQLIDAASGNHLWAERYDRKVEDIFEVQDKITETVVGRIEPEIGSAERRKIAKSPHPNLQAWDCYHLGLANFYKFTAAANREAQRLLQKSRELDPDFAEAHAWWSYAVILGMVYWDDDPEPDLLDAALSAAREAVALDNQDAVMHMLLGRVNLARREYSNALAENEIAVQLNPTLAPAFCALGDSLAYEGRYDEAVTHFEKAIEMSPNHPQMWAFLSYGALNLLFKGDYDRAVEWAERARTLPNCQYWATAHAAAALALDGRDAEAREMARQLAAEKPDFSLAFAERKLFFVKRPEQLSRYLDGLRRAGVVDK